MNTERFEERLMLELRTRVQERAQEQRAGGESVAVGVDTLIARQHGRRRLRLGVIAAATGLTAAIATAVYTSTSGAAQHPLFQMANADYAVQQEPTGIVRLTILDAEGKPDVTTVRDDLAKAGINARVLAGVPDCRQPQPQASPDLVLLPPTNAAAPRDDVENGKLVFYIDPREVVPGVTFSVMYGQSLSSFAVALSAPDDAPTCIPTTADH